MPVRTVSQTPVGLYQAPAYDQPAKTVVITNLDSHNTLYYSDNPGTIDAQSSIIPPQYAETFDGSTDVWASTLSSTAIQADVKVGSSNLTIGVTSPATPLVQEGSVTGGSIASFNGSLVIANLFDVSAFNSYDLNMYAYAASPGSANAPLSVEIQIQWFDDLISGIPVFEEDWWVWIGRTNFLTTNASALAANGPIHGRYMTVTLNSSSSATSNINLQYFNLFGSNRIVPYSDWRQNAQLVNPQIIGLTIQPAVGSGFDNVLASASNVTLGANVTGFVPINVYSGPVWYRFQTATALVSDPVIAHVRDSVGGSLIAGTGCPGVFVNIPNNTNENSGMVQFPRSCSLLIVKASASGAIFSFDAIAQQAA